MESICIKQQASKAISNDLPVQKFSWLIAVGASAGGVATLKELLLNLPEQLINITVFIGFPIDKSNKQLLQAAVNTNRSITIKQARHGEEIQTGIIYYIGPGYELNIKATHLQLNITTETVQSNPVDKLFESLSVTAGEKSVTIVLSGKGTDGAKGIKILKKAGGYVIVQSPTTAMYNAMPIAAIKTNAADLVIPPFKMGSAIWSAVQLQQVTVGECAFQTEPGNRQALLQTAMGINKNGVTPSTAPYFFLGALF